MACGFNLDHYFETIEEYRRAGYSTGPVSSFQTISKDKHILLRHDIDVSLEYGAALAMEESKRGYTASYYILLNSPFYNAFDLESIHTIQAINNAGHEIGLHLDTRFFDASMFALLGNIIDKPVTQFSHHSPSDTPPIPNYVENVFFNATYPLRFGYKYLSDSGKNWREGCFCKWIDKADKIEVLMHPIWWLTKDIKQFYHDQGRDLSRKLRAFNDLLIIYLKSCQN